MASKSHWDKIKGASSEDILGKVNSTYKKSTEAKM
jgi:hypothetical protein